MQESISGPLLKSFASETVTFVSQILQNHSGINVQESISLKDANWTEEQMDAVSLPAWSLQRRLETPPDKSTVRLPVATPTNNHRAFWFGAAESGSLERFKMSPNPLLRRTSGQEVAAPRRNPTMLRKILARGVACCTLPMGCSWRPPCRWQGRG